jgi:hypothetical protein
MAERILPNPDRFKDVDEKIADLQRIKQLMPSDEEIVKYGPSLKKLKELNLIGVKGELNESISQAQVAVLTVLNKIESKGDEPPISAHQVVDIVRFMLNKNSRREEAARGAIWDLIGSGYLQVDRNWDLKLSERAKE